MLFAKIAQFTCIGLAALGVYSFVSTARDGETRRACTPLCAMQPDYAARNRQAPDFELPKLGGGTARLSSYRGKTVILNFWTKTCPPLLGRDAVAGVLGQGAGSPSGHRAAHRVHGRELGRRARDDEESVLGGAEPPFVVMIDPESKVVRDTFGTKLYPETWFIDPTGAIRARVDGGREWNAALTIDLAHSFDDPLQCGVEFRDRRPEGPFASICGEIAPTQ